jgi:ribosomal protein S18 acetylase RimI-like enzyme
MVVVSFGDEHFDGVQALWARVFPDDPPWNRAERALPAKLAIGDDLLLVALAGDEVIGTVMAGYDGHRGWLYAVAVAPETRGAGVGTALVRAAEFRLAAMGCVKINLQVRAGNDAAARFWTRQGYDVEERISFGKLLR